MVEAKEKLSVINESSGDEKAQAIEKDLEEGGIALLRAFRGLPKNTEP